MKGLLIYCLLQVGMMAYSTEVPKILRDLKLVGLIQDQRNPLRDSIIVIRDVHAANTYTIRGQQPIPGSDLKLYQIAREHILVSDSTKIYRITKLEGSQDDLVSEPNSLDDLEADAIAVESNLDWKKLKEKNPRYQKIKPKEVQPYCVGDHCEKRENVSELTDYTKDY